MNIIFGYSYWIGSKDLIYLTLWSIGTIDRNMARTPQYKHRRFAQLLFFSSSDNGPRLHVASISIGIGTSVGVMLDDFLESGIAATDA